MIEAIGFDWGNVLIDNPSPGLAAYCAEHLGAPEKETRRTFRKFAADFQKGIILEDEWWERVCSELGVSKPKIPSLWGDAVREVFPESEKKEVFALIRSLRRNGYKIGFLSNTERPAMDFFKEQNYEVFDEVVFSCAEGIVKPERRIYEILLERLGVKPEEAIFVDDRKENIEAAEEVGINGILFEDPGQLKEKLISLSVEVD